MIDSKIGVRILAGVAVASSVVAIAWRVPVPKAVTGPVWPDFAAEKIHRVSITRPGKLPIELERDAGAPVDDWHFVAMPTIHPSLPALHDFFAVAASTKWRTREVAAQREPAIATIVFDGSTPVAIGAPLPGVGAARWHRGKDTFLVEDWIATALLQDADKLQIPGPWKVLGGAQLQLAITGDVTPAQSVNFTLQGPPFITAIGTPAQTFVLDEQVSALTSALNSMVADAVPPSPADLPARADPSNLAVEVNHARVAIGAPCVNVPTARVAIGADGAWCIDTARITVVLALVRSFTDAPAAWIDSRPIVGDVKSIRIADKIELTAHGATWRIASLSPPSDPVDADGPAVENLIAALHLKTQTVTPPHGITLSHPYLSVTTTSSPQPFTFEWDPVQHTLHRDLDPVLLGLSDAAAVIVATELTSYRDRTLWTDDENNIDQITIVDGRHALRMWHRGAVIGEWFSSTNSKEGPSAEATDIASIAASLRVEAFVAKPAAMPADARHLTLHFAAPPFTSAAPTTHVIVIAHNCIGTVDDQAVRFDAPTCKTLLR